MIIKFGLSRMEATYGIIDGHIEIDMPIYFAEKQYGPGCKEIHYYLLCENEDLVGVREEALNYRSKVKRIECVVKLNYNVVSKFDFKKEFISYEANCFLSRANDFYDLNIKDFDVDSYINDLENFFNEHIDRYEGGDGLIEDNSLSIMDELQKMSEIFPNRSIREVNNPPVQEDHYQFSENAVSNLKLLKKERKFEPNPEGFYSGIIDDEELKKTLTQKINESIDDFIIVAESSNPTKEAFLAQIERGLERIGPSVFDTEDSERICEYYMEMMEAVGLRTSEGLLNNWLYGFDPSGS